MVLSHRCRSIISANECSTCNVLVDVGTSEQRGRIHFTRIASLGSSNKPRSSVGRLKVPKTVSLNDQPRISRTVRLAVPITFIFSASVLLFPFSFSFSVSQPRFSVIAARLLLRRESPSRLLPGLQRSTRPKKIPDVFLRGV